MKIIATNLEETRSVGRMFVQMLGPSNAATVVELKGELGAGKTTFVQSVAQELGVKETVASPTFVIQKRYPIPHHKYFKTLIHIDAYRLENPKEIETLDWQKDLQNPENLIFVEWPSKIEGHIPKSRVVNLHHKDENKRVIEWKEA